MAASAGDETALKCAYQQGKKNIKSKHGIELFFSLLKTRTTEAQGFMLNVISL